MKMTFIETPVFTKLVNGLLSDNDYRLLQNRLLLDPAAGNLIKGSGGCRKIRWKQSDRSGGKRGGIRVIYYWWIGHNQFFFLLAYDHRRVDDLTESQKKQLAGVIKRITEKAI